MIWLLIAIAVIVIYNAEKMPDIVAKFKQEVPHIVEESKKASQKIKEKAATIKKTENKDSKEDK